MVHGGKEAVDALCTHPHVKAVSFVGSTGVGTHVYRLGSEHGKRVQSMMGAKNHAVVLPDANREQTLNALVGAAFGAAGQRCMATSVVVLVGAARDWVPDLAAKARTLKVNAGHEAGTDVGPVVSKPQAKARIERLIDQGVEEGASLLLDGRDVKVPGYEDGNFVGPTLFAGVRPDMRDLPRGDLRAGAGRARGRHARRGHRPGQRQPLRQRRGPVHAERARRRASSRARSTSARSASTSRSRCRCRSSASPVRAAPSCGDLGPYGKQVVQFYTQTKTVTARWFDDATVNDGVNTTISLR